MRPLGGGGDSSSSRRPRVPEPGGPRIGSLALEPTIVARALCGLALAACVAAAASEPAHECPTILQVRVDQIRNSAPVQISGETIASVVVLPDFYERRGFRPAWTEAQTRTDLLAALRGSAGDGLDPRDYHVAALDKLLHSSSSPESDADFDMLATDGVIRLAYHLRFGKVDQATVEPDWKFLPDLEAAISGPPALVLERMLDEHRVAAVLDSLRPQHRMYGALRRALQTYRDIEAAGGWKSLPEGPTLRPGEEDSRLPALRLRLAVEGETTSPPLESTVVYDSVLVTAVRNFQERHGLNPDGVLGKGTLLALNVPVAIRISQLRCSLERGRLLLQDLPARFVLVNIPGFRVYYVDEGRTRFVSKVIVGKAFTQTPIFRAEMTYVVLNPSWTIPPGIMKSDVIPGMRRDPHYLERKGYQEVGGQIVQPPGPNNPLGRLKLMFPNPHSVYLHDTPQRNLFAAEGRTFSHGCIRVEGIVDLAVLVLDDSVNWSKEKVEAALATGRTQNVTLKRPIPVLLTYWTAVVGPGDDWPRFYDDVYGRDAAFLAALDRPFQFQPRVVSRAAAVSGAR